MHAVGSKLPLADSGDCSLDEYTSPPPQHTHARSSYSVSSVYIT